MPESIEVEIMCNNINNIFKNSTLTEMNICSGRYIKHGYPDNFKKFNKRLPLTIDKFNIKGKLIWINFKNSEWSIIIKLGLTGRFTTESTKHTHYKFITNKGIFYIEDIRSFGTLQFTDDPKILIAELSKRGPDVRKITKKEFINLFNNINQTSIIGTFLLNQNKLAGIGNYLRSDILYHSKISPHRPLKSLSNVEILQLYKSMKYILNKSYKEQIKKGLYNYDFLVYKVKDNTKNKNGDLVKRVLIGTRYMYWAPYIQK
jgi:formamidopyrimidine-DNA glycosylase